MIGIIAAGGVLYRERDKLLEVVLIYRNGVWDLPKGKKEKRESIEACACREVAEEVGISLPQIDVFLMQTHHTYHQEGKSIGKTTHWYRMRTDVDEGFTPEQEEGIEEVRWVPIDEALKLVGYENLRDVLKSFINSMA